MRRTHRCLVLITSLAAACGVVAACSAGSPAAKSSKPQSIQIGVINGVPTLDPDATVTAVPDDSVLSSVYSALIDVGANGKTILPDVASSWADVGNKVWTFHLNPKVIFADGTRLTAGDVVWNFKRFTAPGTDFRIENEVPSVELVKAPNPTTVVITLLKPDSEFLYLLSHVLLLSESWVATHDPTKEAMGSGPYRIVSYSPGGNVVLTANSRYWGHKPAIAHVTFVNEGGYSASLAALEAGEIQVMPNIAPSDVPAVRADGQDVVNAASSGRVAFVLFNTLMAPLNDVRVRQALNYAVNKEAIIRAVLGNTTTPSPGEVLNATYAGFDPSLKPYPYDPAKARQLLAAAGYSKGFTLNVNNATSTYLDSDAILEAIGAQLAQVGVTLKINDIPFQNFMTDYVGQSHDMGNMNAQYLTFQSITTGLDLTNLFSLTSIYSYYHDSAINSMLDAAVYSSQAGSLQTRYARVNSDIREQAPVLFLFTQPAINGVAKNVLWTAPSSAYLLPANMSFK